MENARGKKRLKRGSGHRKVDLNRDYLAIEAPSDNILALDEALAKLADDEYEMAELVKLNYFAGLTREQAGEIIGVSRRTAYRYWAYARAWLHDRITEGDPPGSE